MLPNSVPNFQGGNNSNSSATGEASTPEFGAKFPRKNFFSNKLPAGLTKDSASISRNSEKSVTKKKSGIWWKALSGIGASLLGLLTIGAAVKSRRAEQGFLSEIKKGSSWNPFSGDFWRGIFGRKAPKAVVGEEDTAASNAISESEKQRQSDAAAGARISETGLKTEANKNRAQALIADSEHHNEWLPEFEGEKGQWCCVNDSKTQKVFYRDAEGKHYEINSTNGDPLVADKSDVENKLKLAKAEVKRIEQAAIEKAAKYNQVESLLEKLPFNNSNIATIKADSDLGKELVAIKSEIENLENYKSNTWRKVSEEHSIGRNEPKSSNLIKYGIWNRSSNADYRWYPTSNEEIQIEKVTPKVQPAAPVIEPTNPLGAAIGASIDFTHTAADHIETWLKNAKPDKWLPLSADDAALKSSLEELTQKIDSSNLDNRKFRNLDINGNPSKYQVVKYENNNEVNYCLTLADNGKFWWNISKEKEFQVHYETPKIEEAVTLDAETLEEKAAEALGIKQDARTALAQAKAETRRKRTEAAQAAIEAENKGTEEAKIEAARIAEELEETLEAERTANETLKTAEAEAKRLNTEVAKAKAKAEAEAKRLEAEAKKAKADEKLITKAENEKNTAETLENDKVTKARQETDSIIADIKQKANTAIADAKEKLEGKISEVEQELEQFVQQTTNSRSDFVEAATNGRAQVIQDAQREYDATVKAEKEELQRITAEETAKAKTEKDKVKDQLDPVRKGHEQAIQDIDKKLAAAKTATEEAKNADIQAAQAEVRDNLNNKIEQLEASKSQAIQKANEGHEKALTNAIAELAKAQKNAEIAESDALTKANTTYNRMMLEANEKLEKAQNKAEADKLVAVEKASQDYQKDFNEILDLFAGKKVEARVAGKNAAHLQQLVEEEKEAFNAAIRKRTAVENTAEETRLKELKGPQAVYTQDEKDALSEQERLSNQAKAEKTAILNQAENAYQEARKGVRSKKAEADREIQQIELSTANSIRDAKHEAVTEALVKQNDLLAKENDTKATTETPLITARKEHLAAIKALDEQQKRYEADIENGKNKILDLTKAAHDQRIDNAQTDKLFAESNADKTAREKGLEALNQKQADRNSKRDEKVQNRDNKVQELRDAAAKRIQTLETDRDEKIQKLEESLNSEIQAALDEKTETIERLQNTLRDNLVGSEKLKSIEAVHAKAMADAEKEFATAIQPASGVEKITIESARRNRAQGINKAEIRAKARDTYFNAVKKADEDRANAINAALGSHVSTLDKFGTPRAQEIPTPVETPEGTVVSDSEIESVPSLTTDRTGSTKSSISFSTNSTKPKTIYPKPSNTNLALKQLRILNADRTRSDNITPLWIHKNAKTKKMTLKYLDSSDQKMHTLTVDNSSFKELKKYGIIPEHVSASEGDAVKHWIDPDYQQGWNEISSIDPQFAKSVARPKPKEEVSPQTKHQETGFSEDGLTMLGMDQVSLDDLDSQRYTRRFQ
jgi:hypothetical protein